jgi:transcription-repair coupling factor (superfamily II helicase)
LDLNSVLQRILDQPQSRRLENLLLKSECQRIHLAGLSGSSDALLLAAFFKEHRHPALFIFGDREEAAYFQNDLENILGVGRAVLYPSSYKKPYQIDLPDNGNILQRAEVLTRINKTRDHFIIVTDAEAALERVITKKTLERNTLDIKVGQKFTFDFLMEFLQENTFERIDFVFEPGQYSIRGGIMDIYSFAHELPFRIELNGDKIESIRSFDPSTQLSEQSLGFVTLIPNIQSGLITEEHESFFDFLPDNTIIYTKDLHYSMTSIQASMEMVVGKYGHEIKIDDEQAIRRVDDLFDTPELFKEKLEKHIIVELGNKPYYQPEELITYSTKPQPHFNKNFGLLLDDLFTNQKKAYTNFLFAESAKQSERLYTIFEDLPRSDENKGLELKFHTIHTALHQGFIHDDLKIICYTDHQIFNRYHRFRLKKELQ